MQLNILYQSDRNTQLGLGVSIVSLLINNSSMREICIYLIDDGIDSLFLKQLEAYIEKLGRELIVIPSKILLNNPVVKEYPCYTGKRKNRHSYLKLFWDYAIEKKLERLLYLDCDTIVRNDLSELLTINMGNNIIGMGYDALITDEIIQIGLKKEDPYFNSGVILFQTTRWIEEHCGQRIIQHLKRTGNYGTVDQDVLNVEFFHQIYALPIQYNFQSIHFIADVDIYCREFKRTNYYCKNEILAAQSKSCIIHAVKFMGQNTWEKGNRHPCKGYFEEYLNQTPWKNLYGERRKFELILTMEKILYIFLPRRFFVKIFHNVHRLMIKKSNFSRNKNSV